MHFPFFSHLQYTQSYQAMKYLVCFFLFCACGTSPKTQMSAEVKISQSAEHSLDPDELVRQLNAAISPEDSMGFAEFFDVWHKSLKPNESAYVEGNDTIKAVYATFRSVYKPLDLLKLGQWEWGNRLNLGAKYIAIQDSIKYGVLESDSIRDLETYTANTPQPRTLFHFRPLVDLRDSRVLYLAPEYGQALNRFLGAESSKLGEGGIMNPSMPKGESERRYRLLRPWLPILHGHWGGYWHLATHPAVELIVFNRTLNEAMVYFRVGYQGGHAILSREGSQWKIMESKATWIE
jgi:hypothetical protein